MKSKNDIKTFTQAVDECQGILFKVCLMFSHRNSDDIRDLYQDIVCNLWEGWSSFVGQCSVSSWVYKVALNTAIDRHRRQAATVPMVRLDMTQADLLAHEVEDELVSTLYAMAERLNPDEKALLRLYLDKVKLCDMALILGISQDAVKKRIQRMKEHLITISKEEQI